jgi:hypothetical protein
MNNCLFFVWNHNLMTLSPCSESQSWMGSLHLLLYICTIHLYTSPWTLFVYTTCSPFGHLFPFDCSLQHHPAQSPFHEDHPSCQSWSLQILCSKKYTSLDGSNRCSSCSLLCSYLLSLQESLGLILENKIISNNKCKPPMNDTTTKYQQQPIMEL